MPYNEDTNTHAMCEQCGREFVKLKTHWSTSDCDYPEMSKHQTEVAIGVLMGDGSIIQEDNRTPHMSIVNINKKYIQKLDKIFSPFTTGVHNHTTAEQQAKYSGGEKENYNEQYKIVVRNPDLSTLLQWYDSGKKVFDYSITITNTMFLHWYLCDGTLDNYGEGKPNLRIAASNEEGNENGIRKMFNGSNIPQPSWFDGKDIVWDVDKTEKILSEKVKPVENFEYKWGQYNAV